MESIEVIQLRLLVPDAAWIAAQVAEALERQADAVGRVAVFRRTDLDGDVAVHIGRAAASEDRLRFSPEGLDLAARLAARGLVDHSLWRETG